MRRVKLFSQRRIWVPTIYGWLVLLLAGVATGLLLANSLYSFLATNEPAGAQVLVVEGWLVPEELDQAILAYQTGKYERIVTTGGPISIWPMPEKAKSYAELAASYFVQHGISPDQIIAVPAPRSAQERTFLSAVMFREAMQRQGMTLESIDLFSAGPHARRSRLLFQMALGQKVRVGVMAAQPNGFNPKGWWRTSVGVEQMFFQSFGYAWVKCCFWPGPPGSREELWARP